MTEVKVDTVLCHLLIVTFLISIVDKSLSFAW